MVEWNENLVIVLNISKCQFYILSIYYTIIINIQSKVFYMKTIQSMISWFFFFYSSLYPNIHINHITSKAFIVLGFVLRFLTLGFLKVSLLFFNSFSPWMWFSYQVPVYLNWFYFIRESSAQMFTRSVTYRLNILFPPRD